MPGIWLDDDTYQQTAGQIWAQQAHQQLQAGEDWAQQAMRAAIQPIQDSLSKLQSMVPSVPTAAPVPQAPPPTAQAPAPELPPPPAPVAPATPPLGVGQTQLSEPPPTPAAPAPTAAPTPAPAPLPETPAVQAPTAPSDMASAGANWAQQQIQNLLNPAQAQPQTASTPAPTPSAIPGLDTSAALPSATTGPPTTPGAPAGPQPNTPGDLIDQTRQAAIKAGIDPDIFSRQINQESGFNPNAQSGAGAQGIAQFMPATARGLGIDPTDPGQALPAAANLMKSYLDKYGGDWSRALAAYNAGPGNVDQYGGVPPFEETQRYVKNILGGAQNLVQDIAQKGQTAVNTAVQGVQSAVARVSQFGMGLSSGDAMAFCGPAAAMAFAQTYGRNPTVDEAKQLAQKVGWDPSQGMAGPQSEVKLLNAMGIDAHMTSGVDWQQVGQDAAGGNPVIIDTPGHYYYVDGYNAKSGQFHVGTSGTDLKGGSEWMTAEQINAMPQSHGGARAAIFADHPLSGPGQAAAVGPFTMGANQPASSQTQKQADAVGNAVLDVGGQSPLAQFGGDSQMVSSTPLLGGAQDLLSGLTKQGPLDLTQSLVSNALGLAQPATDLLSKAPSAAQDLLNQINPSPYAADISRAPQSIADMLTQNALISQGMPTVQGALSSLPDLSARGIVGLGNAAQAGLQDVFGTPEQPSGLAQLNAAGGIGPAAAQALFGTPEQPSGFSQAVMGGMPSPAGLLGAGERAGGQALMQALGGLQPMREVIANAPVLGGTLGMLRGPELLSDEDILQSSSPQDIEAARQMHDMFNQVAGRSEPMTDQQLADMLRQQREMQAVAMASPSGGPSLGDWARGAYRGGVIGGLNTMADVAANATITPVLSGVTGALRDLASFQPGRLQGRVLGAQSGIVNWTDNFLQGLSDSLARPTSLSGQTTGAPGVVARLLEGAGAIHGAFQNATSELIQSMERGAAAGAAASDQGLTGPAWFQEFHNQAQNPNPDVAARAQAMGDRTAARGDLGTLTSAFGRFVNAAGPIGDALFPVYRMGMALGSRMVESTPLGLAGTGFDIARGLLGHGPYAELQQVGLRGALDITPKGSAVGPIGERLANNVVGTALSMWLANQAVGGAITGDGPSDPAERAVWIANGNQPHSFRTPDGTYHDWQKLAPGLRGPMMAAGAYADAVQAYNAASAKQSSSAAGAYAVQDPRMAAAAQLVSEVGQQLASATPMRTFANLYDALKSNTSVGSAGLTAAGDVASSVLGGAVPFSGLVRSVAQMTDPLQRQPLRAETIGQLPQSVLENVAQNIPGLRENLPARVDVLGRGVTNPLQGLGEILPAHTASGQASPILEAMQNAGVAPQAAPTTVPFGPTHEIRLTPDEQRQWEVYRGNFLQQLAAPLVTSAGYQQMPANAQRLALSRIDTNAAAAANRLMVRDLAPTAQQRWSTTGRLAPVVAYTPNVVNNQAAIAQQQALMQALLGGQSAQDQARVASLIANA